MRFVRQLFYCVLCLLSVQAFAQVNLDKKLPAKSIIVAADEWCPINCAQGSGQSGIGIELAKRVFEPLGYQVVYEVMPWTEALAKVREGKVDAVVGATREDDATLLFPENAIAPISDDFYVLAGNAWRYQGEYTLKGKRIGIIDSYGYGSVVKNFIDSNKQMPGMIQASEGKDALAKNIQKLRARKIDILIESKAVMDYTIKTQKLDNDIIWAGGVPQGDVYLAFSPALAKSKALAAEYDAGIKRLRNAGLLEGMYAVYGMKP